MSKVIVQQGHKPILFCSIHHKEWATPEIATAVSKQNGLYSLVYTGPRETCWREVENTLYKVVDNILAKHGRAGVVSMHRRSKEVKVNPADSNIFELGTLWDQTLDTRIKDRFSRYLAIDGLTFDDNEHFVGGTEIQRLHQRYNHRGYVHKKTKGHDPAANRVQIAQVEINGYKKGFGVHAEAMVMLAYCMERYHRETAQRQ